MWDGNAELSLGPGNDSTRLSVVDAVIFREDDLHLVPLLLDRSTKGRHDVTHAANLQPCRLSHSGMCKPIYIRNI